MTKTMIQEYCNRTGYFVYRVAVHISNGVSYTGNCAHRRSMWDIITKWYEEQLTSNNITDMPLSATEELEASMSERPEGMLHYTYTKPVTSGCPREPHQCCPSGIEECNECDYHVVTVVAPTKVVTKPLSFRDRVDAFATLLRGDGYIVDLKSCEKLDNYMAAKLGVTYNGQWIGYFNIYHSKKHYYHLQLHECVDREDGFCAAITQKFADSK